MKTTIPLVLTVLFAICISSGITAQGTSCNTTSTWTFNPPLPDEGFYSAGTTVDICVQVTSYESIGADWLRVMQLQFPEPWDLSTLQSINAPQACANGGEWLFFHAYNCGEATGPGYFYDVNSGGPQDGNPCNNFGDPCFNQNANWQFCIQITLGGIGSNGLEFQGADITPSLIMIDDNSSFPIEVNCGLTNVTSPNTSIYFNSCDANPGIGSSFIPICGTEPFCLFNELSGEPQSDGLWTGPSGWTADECGTYNPTTDPAGDYSYTVAGEGGCQLTSTTYLGLNDLGTVPTVTYCQSAAVSLFNLLVSPVPITNGVWYYPESAGGGIVPASIVNPLVDPTGLYTYQFLNSNQCASLLSAEVRFTNEGRSGESTTVDYCPLQGDFCPLNLLEGNPDPGGVWILYNANYGFQGFEPISEICYTPNQLLLKFGSNIVNGFSMVYIIGNPPCAPSIDTLTVNYITPFDNNCSSISGIVNIGENCGSRIATLQAFYPDATNPFETYNLLVDELGHFEVGVSLPPHVNLSLKMVGYLSTSINGVTLINGENSLDFGTPKAGDIGGDNIINMVDVSLLNTAFLSVYGDVNFNRNADLNCNGIVNLVDASLLSSAFGLSGE